MLSLEISFLLRKHKKFIYLKERIKQAQVVIIKSKMMKLIIEWARGKNLKKQLSYAFLTC
jgi:hypothetical protein